MSSLRLNAPPCWDCASRSSLARRWAIVFSRRWRGRPAGPAGGGEPGEPADGERAGAAGRDLDGHLVGGAADAAGADLEDRREDLDRGLELLDRIRSGALGDDGEGVVDDLL